MKRFFIWCSGISPDIVLECDSKEQIKYVNIGIVILAVALLAVFSSTFFLSFAFDVTGASFNLLYLPIGIIWGFIILSLDRAIVSTINKKDKFILQISKAIPRFLLALMIGLVVATPLEFKIFEKEINTVIDAEVLEIVQEDKAFQFKNELEHLETQVVDAEEIYLRDKQMYEDEVEGRKSGIPGRGSRANEYMKNELASLAKLNILKDSLNIFKERMIDYESDIDWDEEVLEYRNYHVGVLDRVHALYSLGYTHTLIAVLFILIELLPLLIKLMSPSGSYEEISENVQTLSIKQSTIGLEYSIFNLEHDMEIKKKKQANDITLLDTDLNHALKYKEREYKHNSEKNEIDYDNDLILHTHASDKNRMQREEELGLRNVQNIPEQKINEIPKSQDVSLERIYWRQIDNPNNVYYFDTQNVNRTLLKPVFNFYKGAIETGSWHYKKGKEDILIISLKSTKMKYIISELTQTRLTLKNNKIELNFERVDYL